MRASRWSFTGGHCCRLRIDKHCGACHSFSCFLHHFTELGEMPFSTLSSNRVGVGCRGPVAYGEDICVITHCWHIWDPEIGGYEMCCIDSQGWGPSPATITLTNRVKRSPLLFPPPTLKINSLLELHHHQWRYEIALNEDRRCSPLSDMIMDVLWFLSCCYGGISVVQSHFH